MGGRREEQAASAVVEVGIRHVVRQIAGADVAALVGGSANTAALARAGVVGGNNTRLHLQQRVDVLLESAGINAVTRDQKRADAVRGVVAR